MAGLNPSGEAGLNRTWAKEKRGKKREEQEEGLLQLPTLGL